MYKDWNLMTREERLTVLKQRTEAGDTVRAMAARFRTSPGSISGALKRNGLQTRNKQPIGLQRIAAGFNAVVKNPEKTKAREAKEARQRAKEVPDEDLFALKAHPSWIALPGSRPRPMEDLHLSRDCTWPLWTDNGCDENNDAIPDTEPHVFCGEPCADRAYPYCKAHLRMAFVVLPKLEKPYDADETRHEPLQAAAE